MNTIIIHDKIKGLDFYTHKPYTFLVSEDKQTFYYSEVGVLVSAKFYGKEYSNPEYITENFLNPNWSNPRAEKFAVNIQYDYRKPEDINSFGFCDNSGTRSVELFFNTLECAKKGVLDFLNSRFFGHETVTFRDVALSQSLHHSAQFSRYRTKPCIYEEIITKSKYHNTYEEYKRIYILRYESYIKYRDKLHRKFSTVFGLEIKDFISNAFRFEIGRFLKQTGFSIEELKEGENKNLIKKVIRLYS